MDETQEGNEGARDETQGRKPWMKHKGGMKGARRGNG